MAPILDKSIVVRESDEIKYVRVGDTIALHDRGELPYHDSIALEYFPEVPRSEGKPVVDDAGTVTLFKEKIFFAGMPSSSCKVKGDQGQARAKTKEVAISILGPERVG